LKTFVTRSRIAAAVIACSGAVAIAACGSSSTKPASSSASSGGSTTASTSGSGTASTSGSSGATKAPFAAAVAANAKFSRRPTSVGISTPVGKPIPKGKTIDYVQCGVPACATEGDILQSAAQVLGWKLVRINAGTTPQTITAAYQQAITNKPDAVLGGGYPRTLFNPELKTLGSMHTPVIEAFIGGSAGNGLTGIIAGSKNSTIQGQEVADYILANSTDTSMTVGAVVSSGFPTVVLEGQALTATFKQDCPKCTVKTLNVPVTSIGSDLPTRVASFLTANPSITTSWIGYDDMITGVPIALKGAGVTSQKIATINANSTVATAIQQGDYVVAAVGTSYPEVYWREIDLLARLFTHQSYSADLNDATLPYWTLDKANIPAGAGSTTFANVSDYQQQFKKLWGIN
jgi:ribose transport system substrate-binding protein